MDMVLGSSTGSGGTRRIMAIFDVLFQVVPSALHIDVFLGCKLCAHPIIGSGTRFVVLANPRFKNFFQILAL